MKIFINRIILFSFLAVFLTFLILIFEYAVLNSSKYFDLGKEKKYIFLGHSHPESAYDDNLIDSSLNIAASGESYFYTYIKIEKLLEKNDQELVLFLEFSNNNIINKMNDWIWDDEHIQAKYKLYTPYAGLDEKSFLYTKNFWSSVSCDLKSVLNNLFYIAVLKNIQKDNKMGGYVFLKRDKMDSLLKAERIYDKSFYNSAPVSQANLEYLKKIIKICKQKGVSVYLIRSPLHPQYEGLQNEVLFQSILKNQLNETEFLDFKDYSLETNEYGDLEHLNGKGAKKYSKFINHLLNSKLLTKSDKQNYLNDEIKKSMVTK